MMVIHPMISPRTRREVSAVKAQCATRSPRGQERRITRPSRKIDYRRKADYHSPQPPPWPQRESESDSERERARARAARCVMHRNIGYRPQHWLSPDAQLARAHEGPDRVLQPGGEEH
jgi:hypothetical protein